MLVEWEGGEHSVLAGKYAVGGCFEDGEEIVCKLSEGDFDATTGVHNDLIACILLYQIPFCRQQNSLL